jgi:hypothetical protein
MLPERYLPTPSSQTKGSTVIVYSQDGTQEGSSTVGISDISFQTVC